MAKKPSTKGILDFSKSEAQQPAQDDIVKARGVGLKISEWQELEAIARELGGGMTLHAVSTYAMRYFLKAYREGKIKPETKKTQTLPGL